jgi:hypothetical protein
MARFDCDDKLDNREQLVHIIEQWTRTFAISTSSLPWRAKNFRRAARDQRISVSSLSQRLARAGGTARRPAVEPHDA